MKHILLSLLLTTACIVIEEESEHDIDTLAMTLTTTNQPVDDDILELLES